GVVDLISPRVGLVGLSAGGNSSSPARLILTTDFGRTFTSIGPKTARYSEPDSIYFLDRDHGWFATYSVLTLAETVYRTADGGATWHLLAQTQFGRPGHRHGLPALGKVVFQPGGKVGWLGGGMFGTALYRTGDGGRSWHKVNLRAPRGSSFGLPSITGRTVTEPVTTEWGALGLNPRSATLRVYTSTNDGATWALTSKAARVASPACQGPLATSFPAGSKPWLTAFRNGHVLAYRPAGPRSRWIGHVTPAPVPRGL